MLELESRNLKRIREFPLFESVARVPEVEAYLELWQEREGVRLTAGQKAEVHLELTGSRGVALTIGDPGPAKTSTLAIVERFNEEVLRPPRGGEGASFCQPFLYREGGPGIVPHHRKARLHPRQFRKWESGFPVCPTEGERRAAHGSGSDGKILIPEGQETQVVLQVDEGNFLGARQAEHPLDVVEELRQRGVPVKLHLLGDSKQMQVSPGGKRRPTLQRSGPRGRLTRPTRPTSYSKELRGLLKITRE
ncbi:hypothetical protein [Geomonas anaerohicana]|uniref:Uncharacterized protein n=1 Tax=Geomonas anaerohicana TaxID=2798583 RepID=A0ABS0YK51_9BACT|nr:hypothetical protein [Geomonas anaerohicana]MBJ6752686.1 hypothetical protein [Geomonas anaerohicana]